MKHSKILLVSILTISVLFSCSKEDDESNSSPKTDPKCFDDVAYTDQLPNMDFETWGYPDSSANKYQEPCGGVWASSNGMSIQFNDLITVKASSASKSGSFSAQLKTESAFGLVDLPGILFTGRFLSYQLSTNIIENAELGVPFTARPNNYKGFHKYTSIKQDSAYIVVMLTKYNTVSKTKDTVGFGELTILNSVTSFTEFNIPISYSFSAGSENPDSLLVLFASSKGAEELKAEMGSQLTVDDCTFVY